MNAARLLLACAVTLAPSMASAQMATADNPLTSSTKAVYDIVKGNIIKGAEKMDFQAFWLAYEELIHRVRRTGSPRTISPGPPQRSPTRGRSGLRSRFPGSCPTRG